MEEKRVCVARRPRVLSPCQELVLVPAKRASRAQCKSTSPSQRLCHSPWPESSRQSGPVFTPSWFYRPTVAPLLLCWVSELTAMPRLLGVSPGTAMPHWDALNCCRCVGGVLPMPVTQPRVTGPSPGTPPGHSSVPGLTRPLDQIR